MLAADRYCPRCDTESDGANRVTRWTNEADHGLALACTGCGLTVSSALTPAEQELVAAYEAKPVRQRRRGYAVV